MRTERIELFVTSVTLRRSKRRDAKRKSTKDKPSSAAVEQKERNERKVAGKKAKRMCSRAEAKEQLKASEKTTTNRRRGSRMRGRRVSGSIERGDANGRTTKQQKFQTFIVVRFCDGEEICFSLSLSLSLRLFFPLDDV
jgi:hypothetical protein